MLSYSVRGVPLVAGFSEIAVEVEFCSPIIKLLAFRTLCFDPCNNI